MFRAFLAEDYDGIGQYVTITLSQGAVTSGLKGRIASGDFGGSRVFPVGTPVVAFSYRGQVEVFLGNIPKGCNLLDDFNRQEATPGTTSSGFLWGYQAGGGGFTQPYTNGEELAIDFTDTDNTAYIWFDNSVGGVPELLRHDKFVMTVRFRQTTTVTISDILVFEWYDPSFTQLLVARVFPMNGGLGSARLLTPIESSPNVAVPDTIAGDWYIFKVDFERAAHARLKYYREDDGEPADWLIDLSISDAGTFEDLFLFQIPQQMTTGTFRSRYIDYICYDVA